MPSSKKPKGDGASHLDHVTDPDQRAAYARSIMRSSYLSDALSKKDESAVIDYLNTHFDILSQRVDDAMQSLRDYGEALPQERYRSHQKRQESTHHALARVNEQLERLSDIDPSPSERRLTHSVLEVLSEAVMEAHSYLQEMAADVKKTKREASWLSFKDDTAVLRHTIADVAEELVRLGCTEKHLKNISNSRNIE